MVPGSRGTGGWEGTANGYRVSLWGDENVLTLAGVNGYTTL